MIKSDGNRVVYLLGAGASYNALPIVGEMPTAMRNQIAWFRESMFAEHIDSEYLNTYELELKQLALFAEGYGTIDTYARALYLQGNVNQLSRLKVTLSMFFILEQTQANKQVNNDTGKTKAIDTRYMTWLALLLDNTFSMSKRVKVVSWNYDVQVEHALALYKEVEGVQLVQRSDAFCIHPNPDHSDPLKHDEIFLTHLNGIAGQRKVADGSISSLYSTLVGAPVGWARLLFKEYGELMDITNDCTNSLDDTFTFAWEDKPVAKEGIAIADQMMSAANVLVVVGYSFPAFNRSIDMHLIQAFTRSIGFKVPKRIMIQSPSLTVDTFRQFFNTVLGHVKLYGDPPPPENAPPIQRTLIESSTDTSQFYLPPELF